MFYRVFALILIISTSLISQQSGIFKNPPPALMIPSVLTELDGIPKTTGLSTLEAKWVASSSGTGETLLQSFSVGPDAGIIQTIKNVLTNANIPETKINQIKINFTSSGIEEISINKDSVFFSDEFVTIYQSDNLFLITKLFRTKNARIELVDGAATDFDPAVMDAISSGLRFGNKTESKQENKMIIEIQNLIYGHEYIPIIINRFEDRSETTILGVYHDLNLNSIKTVQTLEGVPYDFFVRFKSDLLDESLLVKVSNVNTTAKFRIGKRESYILKYVEKAGNKVTLTISGFSINFQ